MTVEWLCPDGVVREFLFDTGAATSLIPKVTFTTCWQRLGLRPSRLNLRAVNGQRMPSSGSALMDLRIPGMSAKEKPLISHEVEVMPGGSMPSSLRILGVDFWERLSPRIDWKERMIHCTSPDGRDFTMKFSTTRSSTVTQVNSISSSHHEHTNSAASVHLQQDIHLLPKQQVKVDMWVRNNSFCKETLSSTEEYEPVVSLQSPLKEGYMWENLLLQIRRENDMYCITHFLQNPSHNDTVSFAA